MRTVRPPAVAGRFYPARASELRRLVDGQISQAREDIMSVPGVPKAMLVPHAGYVYSGQTAARAYALLEAMSSAIRRVVVVGPAHYVPLDGMAVPTAHAFATPLGKVTLDRDALDEVRQLPAVHDSNEVHAPEHSLEVQLPFLQRVLGGFTLVPVAVGRVTPDEVAAVLNAVWAGSETLILISTDLSHYLPYDDAEATDSDTLARILSLSGPLPERRACGSGGLDGMLQVAADRRLLPMLLDRRNSGDSVGDKQRVVGYASVSFSEGGRYAA